MKNRIIITLSDVYGSRSYNVNKIIKKLILWIILIVLILFAIGFGVITTLNNSVNELSNESVKLFTQNNIYSEEIKEKAEQIKELGSQLDDIEQIIGINGDEKVSLIQRATLAKLTSKERMYMLQTIPSGCPLEECVVTSKFGYRIHPITKKKRYHKGIDLRAKRKTDVYSTADGVVRYIKDKNDGTFGRVVIISHNFGFETVYAHLRHVEVSIGDIIQKGQLIAKSGNSGKSNGPHLHYEVRYASRVMDPYSFIQWDMKNYENLFETERRIEWESLVNLINNQNKTVVQQ